MDKHFRHHRSPIPASAFERNQASHRRRSRPRLASTCCAPACPPTPSMRPGSSRATRSWPTSNATFASSKPTTWTCGPIYHRLDQRVRAHALICLLACYLVWHLRKAWAPLDLTPTSIHRRATTPSHPHNVPPPPTPKPPINTTPTATRYADSAGLSTISLPSPATASATTTPTSKSTSSPTPPPTNAAPSTSSTPPSPSPSPRSQNKPHPHRRIPRSTQRITYPHSRNFGQRQLDLRLHVLRGLIRPHPGR